MKITYLPHTKRRMEERGISEVEVQAVLEEPEIEYPGTRFSEARRGQPEGAGATTLRPL